jgi:hypothetical protein
MIKPIETFYHGHRFRSRLEARWAVFFDACGAEWEYEPEGFDVGDGVLYLPDFRLYNVAGRGGPTLWVEVKGHMTKEDSEKINLFTREDEHGIPENPLLILGDIPRATSEYELFNEIVTRSESHVNLIECPYHQWEFEFIKIDGFWGTAFPGIDSDYDFGVFSKDADSYFPNELTLLAYQSARIARFEHGETPPTTPIWR